MGNIGNIGEYWLQVLKISDDPQRAEHGNHAHIMRGNFICGKIDLNSLEFIGKTRNMKEGDKMMIKYFIKEHKAELINKAKEIRNK